MTYQNKAKTNVGKINIEFPMKCAASKFERLKMLELSFGRLLRCAVQIQMKGNKEEIRSVRDINFQESNKNRDKNEQKGYY